MDIPSPVLYRKRLIPSECIRLDQDIILYRDSNIMVTKWIAIHPKPKLTNGYSCYFFNKGIKVSKFYSEGNVFRYWYCDIIDVAYPAGETADLPDQSRFVATDLLADVIVYPDGFVKVVDLDELTVALEKGFLDISLLKAALNRLSALLDLIYSGEFLKYQQYLEQYESGSAM